ncbi:MAG: hypothetical protein AAFP93_00445 [Bacteroidota bacterium]
MKHGSSELRSASERPKIGIRKKGGGRKKITGQPKTLPQFLKEFVEPTEKKDSKSSLKWTSKSTRSSQAALQQCGIKIFHNVVYKVPRQGGCRRQVNRKSIEANTRSGSDTQLNYINASILALPEKDQPIIPLDATRTWGDYHNDGGERRPKNSLPSGGWA